MFRVLSSLLACVGLTGCQQAKQSDRLPIKQLIEFYKDAPLGKSIDDVSRGLARCTVLIPTEGIHEQGKPLKMASSTDKQGKRWAYVYTDEPELLAAFPKGSPYVKMRFGDVFRIIENDSRFGGVFVNHTDRYMYLIPVQVFHSVREVLDSDPDWNEIPLH